MMEMEMIVLGYGGCLPLNVCTKKGKAVTETSNCHQWNANPIPIHIYDIQLLDPPHLFVSLFFSPFFLLSFHSVLNISLMTESKS